MPDQVTVVGHSGTHTVDVDIQSTDSAVEAILDAIRQVGNHRDRVVLCPSFDFCFGASFVPSQKYRRHELLDYEFEEFLPISIEDVTTDFSISPKSVYGVAIETEMWRNIVSGLRIQGIKIGAIVPQAFLICQASGATNEHTTGLFAVSRDEHLEFRDGGIVTWRSRLTQPNSIGLGDNQSTVLELSASEHELLQTASRITRGRTKPIVDLCRGQLIDPDRIKSHARSQLGVLVCFLALLLSVIGALTWKTEQYQRRGRELRDLQAVAFSTLFPGQTIPVGIRKHLLSERRRLRGMSGANNSIPSQESALETLHSVLAMEAGETRFRLSDVRLDGNEFTIVGEVLNHSDADRLAESLRDKNCQVNLPSTRQVNNVISFRIVGSTKTEDAKE